MSVLTSPFLSRDMFEGNRETKKRTRNGIADGFLRLQCRLKMYKGGGKKRNGGKVKRDARIFGVRHSTLGFLSGSVSGGGGGENTPNHTVNLNKSRLCLGEANERQRRSYLGYCFPSGNT